MKTMYEIFMVCLLVAALQLGCKTIKATSQSTTETETTLQADIKETGSVVFSEQNAEVKTDKSVEAENSVLEKTTTKWSEPDSTGRQYPTETTHEKRTSQAVKQNDFVSASDGSLKVEANNSLEDKSQLAQKSKGNEQATETRKDETHKWAVWASAILSLGALVLAYFIFKRFGAV